MRKNAKSILAGLFIAGLSITANAQVQQPVVPASGTGFYVGVHGGYNLPIAKQNYNFGDEDFGFANITVQNGPDKIDDILLSLGKGANFGVNLGYMFTQHVGAELAVDYFMGSKYTAKARSANDSSVGVDQTVSGKSIQLKPTVVIRGKQAQVTPYAKIGAVIGVGNKISYTYNYTVPNYVENTEWEFKEGVSAGFTGSLGADFAINNQVSIFGEITGIAMAYAPKKGTRISYTENGVDYLKDLDVNQKEITFEDEYASDNTDPNQPIKASRLSAPFSSIGLNVGVKFRF